MVRVSSTCRLSMRDMNIHAHSVEYEVSGTGASELYYTVGPRTLGEMTVTEPKPPWRATVVMQGSNAVPMISAEPGDDGGSCVAVIRIDGKETLRGTASGASGTLVCVGEAGGFDEEL